jgi:hypothetical protein
MLFTPPNADVIIPRPEVFARLRAVALAYPLTANLWSYDPARHAVELRGGWRVLVTANN